jgi:hypothetical protein
MIDKPQLINNLRKHILDIVFQKKDGSMRTMKCTLMPSYLPALTEEQEAKLKDKPSQESTLTNIVTVWEINVGWRSFDINEVQDVQFASTN